MALVTRTEVKAALGISGTDDDARIDALLDGVSAAVETYAGRAFTSATVTEYHVGGGAALPLRRYPVTSVTSVTDQATGEVVDASGYELRATEGLLRRLPYGSVWSGAAILSPFYRGFPQPSTGAVDRWKVVYVGGPSTVPADVKLACYETFAAMLTSQGGKQSEKDGDYAVTFAAGGGGLPATAAAMLARYRASLVI